MPTTIVYIDGFNFYYGLLRGGKYKSCKWLDLERLFRTIRQHDDLVAIKYFTAFWPDNSGKRHKEYVRALSQSTLVDVYLGRYKRRTRRCEVKSCTHGGDRRYQSSEEKETDVNIALAMLDDAYQQSCDLMVLVTADSDLVPAVNRVKHRFPAIKVVNYIPGPITRYHTAIDLRTACDTSRVFPANLLPKFQLPPVIKTPTGSDIRKPSNW